MNMNAMVSITTTNGSIQVRSTTGPEFGTVGIVTTI